MNLPSSLYRRVCKLLGLVFMLGFSISIFAAAPSAKEEVAARQTLIPVALGQAPADLKVVNVTLLNVFTGLWETGQDIVIKGQRIAWVGPTGQWSGKVGQTIDGKGLWAVPGFGESHKHIESSYLTPEYEAALVIPFGNTWTVEGSHELSNVIGPVNVDFWLRAAKAGSPLKIFPAIGSATPPTAYERGGGYYGYDEMATFMQTDLQVVGLGEVMDWPAVSQADAPAHDRIWGMIEATYANRGVVEGHGSGLRTLPEINAFAASGLSSDHEVRENAEGLEKLRRGIFLEVRVDTARTLFPYLKRQGITDWQQVSVTTDDRDVHATLELGSMDYNIRTAIKAGVPVVDAYRMGSYNTAKHFRIDHLVGSLAPGRFADVVLINDLEQVSVKQVIANGKLAATDGKYLLSVPEVKYPEAARNTIKIPRVLRAQDFALAAPDGRAEVQVAMMKPFYFSDTFLTATRPVENGVVLAAPEESISKVAMVDRYKNEISVSKMLWQDVGPLTENSALASSQSHDLHNIWVVGNDDAAMAMAANAVAKLQGGWALVSKGQVVATVQLELAGLVSQRPVEAVAKELEALHGEADKMQWIGNPGLPERMRFAFLTASPWRWQLVAPYKGNPGGFVDVGTGETHPVVW